MKSLQRSNQTQEATRTYLQGLRSSTLTLNNAKGLTLLECARNSPSIKAISAEVGDAECHSLIVKTLTEMNVLIGRQIENSDIDIYAYHIKESFPDLKMDEFIFTLKKGMEGGYGKLYGKLNYITINEWLNASWNELLDSFDEEHRKKKSEPIIINPDLLPAFEEAKTKFDLNEAVELEKKKQEQLKPKERQKREQTPAEKKFQAWFKEFDALHKEQDGVFDNAGLRMVNVKGKTVDINQFLNIKLEEK